MSWYLSVAENISAIGFLFSCLLCFCVIFLTLFLIGKSMGKYRYLIILFQISGIIFSAFDGALHPTIHNYNDGFIVFTTFQDFRKGIVDIELAILSGMYYANLCTIAIQFVYRYWAVFDVPKLLYFKSWRMNLWIGYIFLIATANFFSIYYFAEMEKYSENYFKDVLRSNYNLDISEISGYTLIIYDEYGRIRWFNLCYFINSAMIMIFQYGVIIYTAYSLRTKMKKMMRTGSNSLQKLNRQVLKALIIQTLTPTIFFFAPIIISFLITFFHLDINLPSGIFACALAFYPAIDAFILMYIVSVYRNVFRTVPSSTTAPSAQPTPAVPLAVGLAAQQTPSSPSDDQALAATLSKKIKEHYTAIEELRQEDRNKWREINKRLEKLEHEKSKKGVKKGSTRNNKPRVEKKVLGDVKSENKLELTPKKEDTTKEKEDEEDLKKKKDE